MNKDNGEMFENLIREHMDFVLKLDKDSEEYSEKVAELDKLISASNQMRKVEIDEERLIFDKSNESKKIEIDEKKNDLDKDRHYLDKKRFELDFKKANRENELESKKFTFDEIISIAGICVTLVGYGIYITNSIIAFRHDAEDLMPTKSLYPGANDAKGFLFKKH